MELELNELTMDILLNINEEDVMFITNPGRMGDEDGSTFIVKNGDNLIAYRAENWMYNTKDCKVTLEDMFSQFPKWKEAWDNASDENYSDKYKYIYMGFGNGLCVDKSIYDIFDKCLEIKVLKRAKDEEVDLEKDPGYKYSLIYNSWIDAVILTANELGYTFSNDSKSISLDEYKNKVRECLIKNNNLSEKAADEYMKEYEDDFQDYLNDGMTPAAVATGILMNYL